MERSRFIRFALRLLLVAAAGDGVRAAEEAGKKAVNDTITATKSELEALKAERIVPLDPRLTLPGMGAPEMSVPSSLPLPRPQQSGPETSAPAKSGAWLIDAMEKNSPRSSDARNRGRTDKPDADLKSQAGLFGDRTGEAAPSDRREPARDRSPGMSAVKDAPNPLTGYMAAWMTPHDFNLLQKTTETGPAAMSSGSPDTPGQSFLLPGSTGFAVTDLSRRIGPAGSVENPYVQAMTQPLPQSPSPVELKAPPPLSGLGSAAALQPPPVTEKSGPFRPEIQKREEDAKYFPQLKRF